MRSELLLIGLSTLFFAACGGNDPQGTPDSAFDVSDVGGPDVPDVGPDIGPADADGGDCVPESEAEICSRIDRCDPHYVTEERCGLLVEVTCGCPASKYCSSESQRCEVCDEESDEAFCARHGFDCGLGQGLDSCERMRNDVRCGACATGFECSVSRKCIACPSESVLSTCSRYDFNCGQFIGHTTCGTPINIAECGPCGVQTDYCIDNACTAELHAPKNDRCDDNGAFEARELYFDANNEARSMLTFDGANDDLQKADTHAPDLVFAIEVDVPSELAIDADSLGELRPYLHLILNDCMSFDRILVSASEGPNDNYSDTAELPPVISYFAKTPGTYYLWVGAAGFVPGTHDVVALRVRKTPIEVAPTNDTCLSAEPIELAVGQKKSIKGTTVGAADSTSDSCTQPGKRGGVYMATLNGGAVYYSFTLGAPAFLRINLVSNTDTSPGYHPAYRLHDGTTCESLRCGVADKDNNTGRSRAEGTFATLPAGDYVLAVKGANGTRGDFTLELTLSPPLAGENCSNPLALSFTETELSGGAREWRATAASTTDYYVDDNVIPPATPAAGQFTTPTSCAFENDAYAYFGSDLVYSFTTPLDEKMNAVVTLTPWGASKTTDSGYFLVSFREESCTAPDLYATCGRTRENPLNLQRTGLKPGVTYYVVVEAFGGTGGGAFNLSLALQEVPPPPINDTCEEAVSLNPLLVDAVNTRTVTLFGNQTAGAPATLVSAFTDLKVPCKHNLQEIFYKADVFYKINVTERTAISLRASSASAGTVAPMVRLRRSCDLLAEDLQCGKFVAGADKANSVLSSILEPGDTYIAVAAETAFLGDFYLDVSLLPLATNTRCGSATALTLDGATRRVTVRGDMGAASSNTFVSRRCNGLELPGLLYKYTAPSGTGAVPVDLTAKLTAIARSTFAPRLAFYNAANCSGAAMPGPYDYGCATSDTPGNLSATYKRLAPGETLYIAVQPAQTGFSPHSFVGLFELTLSTADNDYPESAQNDTCPALGESSFVHDIMLSPFDAAGDATGSTTGNTEQGYDDAHPGDDCFKIAHTFDYRGGRDLVYRLVLEEQSSLKVKVTSNSSAYFPAFYLRTSSCAAPPELTKGCYATDLSAPTPSKEGQLTFESLQAGDYFIWVDTLTPGTEGAFTLSVVVSKLSVVRPANDDCGTPEALNFVGDRAVAHGDTRTARNDYAPDCAASSTGDVVYSFVADADTMLSARVIPTTATSGGTSDLAPALYFAKSCTATSISERFACVATTTRLAAISTIAFDVKARAEPYYLIVDGTNASWGTFDLEVIKTPAMPTPNDCSSAMALDPAELLLEKTVEGSTTYSTNNHTASLSGATLSGRDNVYKLTTTAAADLDISLLFASVTGHAGFVMREGTLCSPTAPVLLSGASAQGGPLHLKKYSLPAATYWLWVDSSSALSGPYRLTLKLSTPPAELPTAQTCTSLGLLSNGDDGGTATVDIARLPSTTQGTGLCSSLTSGGEAIYSFVVPAPDRKVVLTVTPRSPLLQPALYLRATCDSTSELDQRACAVAPARGEPATFTLGRLGAGRYYLYAEDATGLGGALDLKVEMSASKDFPNSCAEAATLPITNGVGRVIESTLMAAPSHVNGHASCQSQSQYPLNTISGNDLVYKVDTAGFQGGTLVAKLVYFGHSFNLINSQVTIRESCALLSAEPRCGVGVNSRSPAIARAAGLTGGTYYVWVDSFAQNASHFYMGTDFELTVELTPPAPTVPTTACTPLEVIELSVPLAEHYAANGTTVGGTTADTAKDLAFDGPSVYYKVRSNATATYAFGVVAKETTPSYIPAAYLRSETDCGISTTAHLAAAQATQDRRYTGFSATLEANVYYLLAIDGINGSSGDYSLDIQRVDKPGNSCPPTSDLSVAQGPVTVYGTTDGATNTTSFSNGPLSSTGGEVIYHLDLSSKSVAQNIWVEVTPLPGSLLNAIVSIRATNCSDSTASSQRAFHYDRRAALFSLPKGVLLNNVSPGHYYVVVDTSKSGETVNSGAYVLNAHVSDALSDPALVQGDNCASAHQITASSYDGQGVARLENLTFEGLHDTVDFHTTGYCGDDTTLYPAYVGVVQSGPDLYITFEIPQGAPRDMTYKADFPGATTDATIAPIVLSAVHAGCGKTKAFDQMACAALDNNGSLLPQVTGGIRGLAPGLYTMIFKVNPTFLYVRMNFELMLGSQVTVAGNGFCASPKPLNLSSGRAQEVGLIEYGARSLKSGNSSTCAAVGEKGKELYYAFSQTSGSAMTFAASVQPLIGAQFPSYSAWRPVLSLRKNDCADMTKAKEVVCDAASSAGGLANLAVRSLPEGDYLLVVDSDDNTATGAFQLAATLVSFAPPASNTTCETATPLTFSGTWASATGMIEQGGENQYTGVCGTTGGRELVYSMLVPANKLAHLSVSSSEFSPALYLRGAGCAAATDLGCHQGSSTSSFEWVNFGAEATYYIFVDSAKAGATGLFTLDVNLSDLPARTTPGDIVGGACAGAIPVTSFGETETHRVYGTTLGAFDDYNKAGTSCATINTGTYFGGDVVYSFTPPPGKKIRIIVTPEAQSGLDVAFWVMRNSCSATTPECLFSADSGGAGATEVISGAIFPPQTTAAYLVIDSKGYTRGNFYFTVFFFD